MFLKTLKQSVKWMAANLAVATMVFSPVALGRESEALNEARLQLYLQELGFGNKKLTVGEFWEKSKVYYPGFIYKDLEKFATENKNMLMPTVTVSNAKATDGTVVPVLRVTSGSKSATIQIFGEKNKWAKYNNVVLSEDDLRSVNDVFKRVEASDIRLKNEADKYRDEKTGNSPQKRAAQAKYVEKMVKDFARFKNFPRMSPEQWKRMTPEQRASFIVNMRLLWKDARQVLRIEEARLQPKAGPKGRKYSSFDEFSRILLGQEAEAGVANQTLLKGAAKPKRTQAAEEESEGVNAPPPITAEERSAIIAGFAPKDPQGKKCIVLGYVSSEGRGTNYSNKERATCSDKNVFESEKYTQNTPLAKMVQEAQKYCQSKGAQYSACNPAIYSYGGDGQAICADRTKLGPNDPAAGNFQKATWWEGPCDAGAKLTSQQIQDGMKVTDSQYADKDKRYDESGNLKQDVANDQIERVEMDQMKNDAFKQTKTFLDNALKSKGKNLGDLLDPKTRWSKEADDMLVEIQTQFETEIGEAIQSCEKSITRKDNVDKNQKGACDQLHRRWLFTERVISQFRAQSCLGGSTYIWKMNETTLSKEQVDIAKLNKEKLKSDSELMCQCNNNPEKKIKFNDDKSCGAPAVPASAKCPAGMEEPVDGFCTCPGGTDFIPVAEAIQGASHDMFDVMCPAKPEPAQSCGMPDGIDGYDYTKCECTKGKLEDENEQGFISKIFHGKEKRDQKWVCKESSWWPWALLGIPLLIALFHKDKKKDTKPPVTCTLSCSGNTTLNPTSCTCTPNPPKSCAPQYGTWPNCQKCPIVNPCVPGQQIYDQTTCQCTNKPEPPKCPNGQVVTDLKLCPKCPDGSMQTLPGPGRPNGCPQSNEGGSGTNQCKDSTGKVIPCSGGVPTGQ